VAEVADPGHRVVLALFWIARTYVKGRQYEEEAAARPACR